MKLNCNILIQTMINRLKSMQANYEMSISEFQETSIQNLLNTLIIIQHIQVYLIITNINYY